MIFPLNLYVGAFGSALVVTAVAVPVWRGLCPRLNLVDEPGTRKIHDHAIPLAGGPALLSGLLVVLVIAVVLAKSGIGPFADGQPIADEMALRAREWMAVLFGAVAITLFGCLDDRFELDPWPKSAGQILIVGAVAAFGPRITLFVPSPVFSYVITLLWILTVINALNFVDNMNGLCAGLGIIGAVCFAFYSAVTGQTPVAMIGFAVSGALLGFLPFNFPRARVFLGDAGSHLVGYLLAMLAVFPHFYSPQHPNRLAVLSPLLILAVPLGDLLWVVLLRWRSGKPFYMGDTNHFSHQLVRAGFTRTKAVLLLWLAAALAGALTFLWA